MQHITDGRGAYWASPGKTGWQTLRSEPEPDSKIWTTYWKKDDFAGLDMFCVWTISAYHSKHCTGRYQDIREDQVDQERTGGAQATKTYKRWGSPGKKQRWQLLTDTDGVGVWPNVSSWMRDEPESKVQSLLKMKHPLCHYFSQEGYIISQCIHYRRLYN